VESVALARPIVDPRDRAVLLASLLAEPSQVRCLSL
jgi:hypothetical protein